MQFFVSPEIKKYIEDNKQQLFIIPTAEISTIFENGRVVRKMVVSLAVNGKVIKQATLSSGDIISRKKILAAFGEKNILPLVDDKCYDSIISQYNIFLDTTPEYTVYATSGWINDFTYLLGNTKISKECVKAVKTQNNLGSFTLESQTSAKHFVEKVMFELFEERAYSQVIFLYLMISLISAKLPQGIDAFSSLLCIIGPSGSRKTSVVNAIFNPFGIPAHNASFEDTRPLLRKAFGFARTTCLLWMIYRMTQPNSALSSSVFYGLLAIRPREQKKWATEASLLRGKPTQLQLLQANLYRQLQIRRLRVC